MVRLSLTLFSRVLALVTNLGTDATPGTTANQEFLTRGGKCALALNAHMGETLLDAFGEGVAELTSACLSISETQMMHEEVIISYCLAT